MCEVLAYAPVKQKSDMELVAEKIKNLEERMDDIVGVVSSLPNKHHDLIAHHYLTISERMRTIEEIQNRIAEFDMRQHQIPHKCPVCQGAGDFQVLSVEDIQALGVSRTDGLGRKFTKCHACEGKGIVWG